ncbi:MAG: hypothetical protein J6T16_02320 [Opitutales bacterium]|nr:hypothetical protein [Opitutales bacterium]
MKKRHCIFLPLFCAAFAAAAQEGMEGVKTIPIDPSQIQVLPADGAAEDVALRKHAIAGALKQAKSDFEKGAWLSAASAITQTFSILGDRDDFENFIKSADISTLVKLDMQLALEKDVPPPTAELLKKIIEVELGGAVGEAMQMADSDPKSARERLRGSFDAAAILGEESLLAFLGAFDYVVLKEGIGGVGKSEEGAEKIFERARAVSQDAEKALRLSIAAIYHYASFSQNGVNRELKAVEDRNKKAMSILDPILNAEAQPPDENACHAFTLASDIILSPDAEPWIADIGEIPPDSQRRAADFYAKAIKASPGAFALEGTAPMKYVSLLMNGCEGVKDPKKAVEILESTKSDMRSQILPRYNRAALCAIYSENPRDAEKAAKNREEYLKLFPEGAPVSGFLENDISFAYKLGIGVGRDAEKARQWAVKGAEAGNFYALWDDFYANAKTFEEAKAAFKELPPQFQSAKALSGVRGLVEFSEGDAGGAARLVYDSMKDPQNILPIANRDLEMLKSLAKKYSELPGADPKISAALKKFLDIPQPKASE